MFQTPRKLTCSAVWLLFGNATLWSCRYWSMKPEAKTQDPLLGCEMTCHIVEINMSVASCFGGTFVSYQPCTWIMWSIWRSICWLKQVTTYISSLSTVAWSQRVDGDCTPFAFGRFFKGVEGSGLLIGWMAWDGQLHKLHKQCIQIMTTSQDQFWDQCQFYCPSDTNLEGSNALECIMFCS